MPPQRSEPSSRCFSCQSCYRRKVKCVKTGSSSCTYCAERQIECIPLDIQGRKKRFPEAELLSRIKKYEEVLRSYGADIEAIQRSDIEVENADCSGDTPLSIKSTPTSTTNPYHEIDQVLGVLDDDMGASVNTSSSADRSRTITNFLDEVFEDDGSSMFLAVDMSNAPEHPAPFDIFKFWQIYCDNIHPLNKTLHAPTFQRKISSFGSHLHLAPAADQALFFAVYVAALSSLSTEECEAIFFSTKKTLLEKYQRGTQFWLRQAGLWRTTNLTVLQAFVLFLSSLHNEIDPRTLASFTAVSERIARRLGLHRESKSCSPIEQEIRKRLWWELILLDGRTAEKAGMGSSFLATNWSTTLPSERSDSDLDSLTETSLARKTSQPSSEMVFFLIRSETAQFLARLRLRQGMQDAWSEFATLQITTAQKLKSIDEFEARIASLYLSVCDESLAHHRMTIHFAQLLIARMRISTYIVEETSKDVAARPSAQRKLLAQCTFTLEQTNRIREDASLHRFQWFIHQHMPIFALIHALRLLQVPVSGHLSDRAWRAVITFREAGLRLPIDSLLLRAWKIRESTGSFSGEEPRSIKDIKARQAALRTKESAQQEKHTNNKNDTRTLRIDNDASSDSDYMSLSADLLSTFDFDFDWSTWLNDTITNTDATT
ncbi:hypothetical protein CBS101457_001461 [Exobasidium rhododendri]|nr:hypothetical protein CBS101457_001461 [Exobasidium rhododendri]